MDLGVLVSPNISITLLTKPLVTVRTPSKVL
jgi:hypothetical protein